MAQTAPPAARGHRIKAISGPARRAVRNGVRRPAGQQISAPPIWRELLLIVLFYTAYTLTRLVLNRGGTDPAFLHAGEVLSLERTLKLDHELSLNQALMDVPFLARAANYFYASMHFVVTLSILVWLYRYRPQYYRWLRTALMAATAFALVGFWLYPLAPPRFLPAQGFVDPVSALGTLGLYSGDASGALTNQYAAMPSMHAGWALWCGMILLRLGTQRWVKGLGVLYPVITVLVILSTANHYILDAVAGVAIVAFTLTASWLIYKRGPSTFRRFPRPPARRREPDKPNPPADDSPAIGGASVAAI